MARTLKTLLSDTYTYFLVANYTVAKQDLSRYVFLENSIIMIEVEDDCSEFAIMISKRVDEDKHIPWVRLSVDNYKDAKKYVDFLIDVVTETAEGGHVCEEIVEGMANRINPYIERKLAREKKKAETQDNQ